MNDQPTDDCLSSVDTASRDLIKRVNQHFTAHSPILIELIIAPMIDMHAGQKLCPVEAGPGDIEIPVSEHLIGIAQTLLDWGCTDSDVIVTALMSQGTAQAPFSFEALHGGLSQTRLRACYGDPLGTSIGDLNLRNHPEYVGVERFARWTTTALLAQAAATVVGLSILFETEPPDDNSAERAAFDQHRQTMITTVEALIAQIEQRLTAGDEDYLLTQGINRRECYHTALDELHIAGLQLAELQLS